MDIEDGIAPVGVVIITGGYPHNNIPRMNQKFRLELPPGVRLAGNIRGMMMVEHAFSKHHPRGVGGGENDRSFVIPGMV